MKYKLSYATGLLYNYGVLACGELMSLDTWPLGCPGSGYTLLKRRLSSFS